MKLDKKQKGVKLDKHNVIELVWNLQGEIGIYNNEFSKRLFPRKGFKYTKKSIIQILQIPIHSSNLYILECIIQLCKEQDIPMLIWETANESLDLQKAYEEMKNLKI